MSHLPGPAVEDQDRDRTVVAEELGELRLDVSELVGRDRRAAHGGVAFAADGARAVPDRVVEPRQQAAASERVDVGAHDVALAVHPGDRPDVEVADRAVPEREAVVVPRGQNTVGHVRGHGGVGPLSGIERGRIELFDRQVGLRPRPRERENSEVNEHAEAKLDVRALRLLEIDGIDGRRRPDLHALRRRIVRRRRRATRRRARSDEREHHRKRRQPGPTTTAPARRRHHNHHLANNLVSRRSS